MKNVDLELLQKFDETSLRFEDAWLDGTPITIESCLIAFEEDNAAELLELLLSIELEYRMKFQNPPKRQEYLDRFPEYSVQIESLFADRTTTSNETDDLALFDNLDELIGDDFELLDEIGRGGMGVVYKARQKSLNCIVALKLVPQAMLRPPFGRERFQLEAESAAKMKHRHIVPIHSVGEWQGNPYYTMDYILGHSLDGVLKESGPFPPLQAAVIMGKISQAVHFAHSRGVIHRDLKPANILLDEIGDPWLTDFGLAKVVDTNDELTMTGQIVGTASYMGPEQARGSRHEISILTDVYSLGATLYALLTGQPPFAGETLYDTLQQVIHKAPKPLAVFVPGISDDLQTICNKCLSKIPEHRYPSAKEVADELQLFVEGRPIEAREIAGWIRGIRWCRRNPVFASLISATIASLFLGILFSVAFAFQANKESVKAKANATDARSIVQEYFSAISESSLLNEPGMHPLRNELLEKAAKYYKGLIDRGSDDGVTEKELAEAYYFNGKVLQSLGQLPDALQSYFDTETILRRLEGNYEGDTAFIQLQSSTQTAIAQAEYALLDKDFPPDYSEAMVQILEHADLAIILRENLVRLKPKDPEPARLLANAQMNRALFLQSSGQLQETQIWLEKSTQTRIKAIRSFPDNLKLKEDLAKGYYSAANCFFEEYLIQAGSPDWEKTYANLNSSIDNAILTFRQVANKTRNAKVLFNLARSHRLRADIRSNFSQDNDISQETAAEDYEKAISLFEKLSEENPQISAYLEQLADCSFNYALLYFKHEKYKDGKRQLDRTTSSYLMIVRRDSSNSIATEHLCSRMLDAASNLATLDEQLAVEVLTTTIESISQVYEAIPGKFPPQEYLERLRKLRAELMSSAADSTT